MSKKRSQDSRSLIAGILGAIVIAIAAYFGVDLTGLIDTGTTTDNPPVVSGPAGSGNVQIISLDRGTGATSSFWEVYFTEPVGRETSLYNGGLDVPLTRAIDNVQDTLDIAAFEWENHALNDAVLRAHQRGVEVRMAIDDEHTDLEEGGLINTLIDAGVSVVADERSGLMHNKFMIMDSTVLWTGSMNFTDGGIYRNNNNLLRVELPQAINAYQTEFNEMFISREFGSSRSEVNSANFFSPDGTQVEIVFSPEDGVNTNLVDVLSLAEESIYFMTFSFTLDEVGEALLARANDGVVIEGIFEVRGSETQFSEMPRLLCAGLDMRQDGNPNTFHHKVFIIDETIVLTGSFNISANATESNDENQIIIADPNLAQQYIAEFERRQAEGRVPDDIDCG